MRRTTILMDEALDSDLRALSRRLHRPLGALVREAIARYVEAHATSTGPALGFVAIGRSGRSDVAERHEELLFADGVSEGNSTRDSAVTAKRSDATRAGKARTRKRARS